MPPVRLQKLLADAGLASRRGAERLIRAGRVTVNGEPVVEPGAKADPLRERISVDGRELRPPEPKRYLLLHKPAGCLTTRQDPRGRPTVFDRVPERGVRLHSVGRLDFDAEGLLLLTNDGELTYRLTHPRHAVPRVYHVLVEGHADEAVLARLRRGVILDDGPARADEARKLRDAGAGTSWLALTLHEGRYREVKRLCRAVGLRVARLVRVAYGPLDLGRLRTGEWRELTAREVAGLRGERAVPAGRARPASRVPPARRPASDALRDDATAGHRDLRGPASARRLYRAPTRPTRQRRAPGECPDTATKR